MIAIVGPGAVGRFLAEHLREAGREVALFGRGDLAGGVVGSAIELAIVTVKAYDVAAALESIAQLTPRPRTLLILSNGLGHERRAAEILGREPHSDTAPNVVSGVSEYGVRIAEDGSLIVTDGRLRIPCETTVVRAFSGIDLNLSVEDDPQIVLWDKVCLNCAINPVATLLRCPNGELLERPAWSIAVSLAEEAARVGIAELRAQGSSKLAEWGRTDWGARLRQLVEATATNRCSMLVDVENGRRTEIDFLTGEVVRRAAVHGIDVPRSEVVARLVESLHR